jgi:hypothetical protein
MITVALCGNLLLVQSGKAAEPFNATLEGKFSVHSANVGLHHTPITTFKDRIYIAYINPKGETVVGMKKQGQWTSAVVESKTRLDPYHTQPSIAVDTAGFIHVVYNMHGTPWQYKVSQQPETITSWDFRGQGAGTNPGQSSPTKSNCTGSCLSNWFSQGTAAIPGNQITYPFMTTDRNGVLYIAYRECFDCDHPDYFRRQWSGGIAKYDVQSKTWKRVGGVRPWAHDTQYVPLGIRMFFDPRNRMHVSWVWGKHYTATAGSAAFEKQPNYPSYAYSDDGGKTFYRADGDPLTLPIRFDQSDRIVPPSWIASPTKGYFLGNTHVTADPQRQPYVIVHPLTISDNVKRAFTTYKVGRGWSYPPTPLPWSAARLFIDTAGTMTAISSGMRFHRSKSAGQDWTIFPLDETNGSFHVMPDFAYFRQTNQFRIYAMKEKGSDSAIKIWTVHFGDTVAPQQESLNALTSPQNLRLRPVSAQ